MLLNTLIFITTFSIVYFLWRFYKNLSDEKRKKEVKIEGKFRFTCPKYTNDGGNQIVRYSAKLSDEFRGFFTDFPVVFKFHSNDKFRATVRITYSVPEDPVPEELVQKQDVRVLAGDSKEYTCEITDIITRQFDFEIELHSHYGDPWIDFTILPSENEELVVYKSYTLKIRFPKIIQWNK